ncbi:MAG: hypothetical protein NVSMB23_30280 [Myxococcales bacterium]
MRQEINPASGETVVPYEAAPVFREEHAEGRVTRLLEQQVAKLPSVAFLAASIGAMAVSLGFEASSRRRSSRFVGMWVGPLLQMGIYVKLVKLLGAR